MVYLYTSELFLTPIRSTAVGVCSTVARIGGIIALLMEGLGSVWKPLPMVIFGAVAFIATVLGTQCETASRILREIKLATLES